uniref:Zinc finger CCCH domain-containing protein 14 n=1 Tax=Takifugu rubripes TaxID=31033 RepID=A0A674MR52_TAKRU
MEIGTEISKNIRAAIKGKLQELGAYIDEELPDYIMVMVANKKNAAQMADDLSLFLGTNTAKFTTWYGQHNARILWEPESFKDQLQSDTNAAAGKGRLSVSEESRAYESKRLTVSSSHLDRTEARISSSAHESRRGAVDKSSSRLTSAVKPLMEALSSEAVIDIKPEIDDDLITEELVETSTNRGRARGSSSRPTAEIYRPGHSKYTSVSSADAPRSTEGPSHFRHQESRSRGFRTGSSKQEELSRKRKAPMASSVVRVSRTLDEDSDDLDEDDSTYGGRGVSSRVSLPSKPERKPTLPPAKQANRNLILKAISEAQDSITKTTSFSTIPQRQMVPVAPRTRPAHRDEMTAAIQLVQDRPQLQMSPPTTEDEMMEAGVMDDGVPLKKQKVLERCKFWPVCKSGDECLYHHPTMQCKTFPNCKFGDKCLFVHPNCKFDARCSKPDCPFTHAGRRISAAALPRPAAQPAKVANVCRFFPECKNVDCQFYHPKPCRFAGMCKRASCTFYHPTTSLPPRHALKWMKSQSR